MTKPRKGFEVLFVQVAAELKAALDRDADASGGSMAKVVTRILCDHYQIDPASLPQAMRAGRKKAVEKKNDKRRKG